MGIMVIKEPCGCVWVNNTEKLCHTHAAARLREEIASLKESLRDVLEISEVEGAVNLTTMESAKLMAARSLLGPESRFA